jgi:putative nucleotidyltransferase with HDIG domain
VGNLTLVQTDVRQRALGAINRLPAFSPILNKLVSTLADENVSFAVVGELIEKDAVLAGRVLRVVNSAIYGRRSQVNSVRHAVSMIGIQKLRNFSLGFLVSSMWSRATVTANWSHSRFNVHSIATALMADLLAQRMPVEYAEGAFTAGLLHDVGKLLLAIAVPDEVSKLVRKGGWTQASELDTFGITHEELSVEILQQWRLPVQILQAVRYHHSPPGNPKRPTLADLVALGNLYAKATDNELEARNPDDVADAAPVLQGWGIDEQIPRIQAEFTAELEAVRSFF